MVWSRLSLIRPPATFSPEEAREKAIISVAFSRFFQREKVAEGRMREFSPQYSKDMRFTSARQWTELSSTWGLFHKRLCHQ
jgi:hypothetical protein